MRRSLRLLACLPLLSTAACAADAIAGPRLAPEPRSGAAAPEPAWQELAALTASIKSMGASYEPLYIIDGVPAMDAAVLRHLDPRDVESIEVVKGTSSALLNCTPDGGVVLITLTRGSPSQRRIAASYRR